MNYHNPYVRIQTYYSWLINDKYYTQVDDSYDLGITVTRLHEIMNIPNTVIRRDFSCMFEWQSSIALFLKNCPQRINTIWDNILTFDDENENYIDVNERYNLDLLYENLMEESYPPKFEKLLIDGILDNVPIYIKNSYATYQISMTPDESEALQNYILTEISHQVFMSQKEQDTLQEFAALCSNIKK